MELILNAFWLALALASLCLWQQGTYSTKGHRGYSTSLHALIILGCALILLFPVISLTDDLHDAQAVMEDSYSSPPALKHGGTHHTSAVCGKLTAPPARVVLPELISIRFRILGLLSYAGEQPGKTASARPSASRAPPLPAL